MGSYLQSKAALQCFTHCLRRKVPWVKAVAAHPGLEEDLRNGYIDGLLKQSVANRAMPVLAAAIDLNADYVVPSRWLKMPAAGSL